MQLIKPSIEILEQETGDDKESILNGIYKIIEVAGRTCYASNDKITPDSSKEFFNKIRNLNHLSVLEHGTVYLAFRYSSPLTEPDYIKYARLCENPHAKVKYTSSDGQLYDVYITTNMRVIVENGWEELLKFICKPTEHHERRYTVRFICDIGVSREFNRHRVNSISEQSTRYCNYSKDKFGNMITYITPSDITHDSFETYKNNQFLGKGIDESDPISVYLNALNICEWSYLKLIELGWKPQQARRVLPLNTKTELVHTAFISDWSHFLDLRCAESAHPDARILAKQLKSELYKRQEEWKSSINSTKSNLQD